MRSVVVTGVSGSLGRRVVQCLAALDHPPSVAGIDTASPPPGPADRVHHQVDLATAELKPLVEGADTIVHLAFVVGAEPDDPATAHTNIGATRRLLDAASATGVESVVVVSSATAYGAWENNPVPLTEDAPLRPNPGFGYGVHKAEVERICAEWADAHPEASVAVLRPAVAVSEDEISWLGRAMRGAALLRSADDAPPAQFLHLDDLAAAVVHAAEHRLDGPYNVAPDGHVSGDDVRALSGGASSLPLPARMAGRLTRLTRDLGLADVPEGLEPYLRHPWVIANDRLRATGWAPTHTNEQSFVVSHPPSRLTEMSPKQRQNLALGATGAGLVGAAAAAVAVLRRRRAR